MGRNTVLFSMFFLCSSFLGAQDTSEPVRLQLRIEDTSTKERLSNVDVKLIRDFPANLLSETISFREIEPFNFFSVFPIEIDNVQNARLLGYTTPVFTETQGSLQAIVPVEHVSNASNLWLELKKEGYYPALRSLWIAGNRAEGAHLAPKLSLTPMKTRIADFDTSHVVEQAGIKIVVPAGACDAGSEIYVDVQIGVSGCQYVSNLPAIHTYPIAIWPPEIQLKKPLEITYLPDSLKGVTEPIVYTFGRVDPIDYSLLKISRLLPNEGKSIEPPFTYSTIVTRGGFYVLAN